MSGIVAVLSHAGAPADRELLRRMTARLRFRGPDGEATWREGSVGLGHAMHKTTVESEREVSPTALDGRLFITADARIDARDELCARLRDHGRALRTDLPDPELLLHAYDAWGEGCLQHLMGDFSFALWDAPARKLVCAVDPLGVKPFFYADRGGLFVGSNSLESVRLHPGVGDQLNDIAVGDFILIGGYQERDITIYADIVRIPPGHFLVVQDGRARLQRYFTLPEPAEASWPHPHEVVEQFQELLGRAVADRLRTPKVAIWMSGGLDSPLLALTAKRELSRRFPSASLKAFTVVFDHLIPYEERYYAGLVASSLDLPIDFQPADDAEVFDWVGRIHWPEPRAYMMLGPQLDQRARMAAEFPVAFSGYDGDSLLLAALRLHWRERFQQGRLGALGRELIWYLRHQHRIPPIGVRTFLAERRRESGSPARPPWLREGFWRRAGLAGRWERGRTSLPVRHSRTPAALSFADPCWGWVFDEYDPSSLGFPIEARHPLMDLRLLRFAFSLPAVPWCVDKYLFRQCLTTLPGPVRRRPKATLRPIEHPFVAGFRRAGFGALGTGWNSPGLSDFVDPGAAAQVLKDSPAGATFWAALRAVALGAWLARRDLHSP